MRSRAAELVGLAAGLAMWTGALLAFHSSSDDRPMYRARRDAPAVRPVAFPTAWADSLSASQPQVRGKVVDGEGHAVAGAAVFVCPLSLIVPPLPYGFVTDAEGRFDVNGLAPGRYSFIAIHGHHPPGAAEAIPVFANEEAPASAPFPGLLPPPLASCEPGSFPTGPRSPTAVVQVVIVLDRIHVLEA